MVWSCVLHQEAKWWRFASLVFVRAYRFATLTNFSPLQNALRYRVWALLKIEARGFHSPRRKQTLSTADRCFNLHGSSQRTHLDTVVLPTPDKHTKTHTQTIYSHPRGGRFQADTFPMMSPIWPACFWPPSPWGVFQQWCIWAESQNEMNESTVTENIMTASQSFSTGIHTASTCLHNHTARNTPWVSRADILPKPFPHTHN